MSYQSPDLRVPIDEESRRSHRSPRHGTRPLTIHFTTDLVVRRIETPRGRSGPYYKSLTVVYSTEKS